MFVLKVAATMVLVAIGFAQTTKPTTSDSAQPPADSTRIEPVNIVAAKYPENAAARGLKGRVVVKVIISEAGDVEQADVITGDPVLTKPSLEAAKQWKFQPYIQNGKPIKVATRIPFDYDTGENVTGVANSKLATLPTKDAQSRLVRMVPPEYPAIARARDLQGTVVLHAIIGKDGSIKDLRPISGSPVFVPSAMDAVRQWRYKPFLLAGEPVEVETQIVVNFSHASR